MGEIRSALEIALDRIKDVKSDPEQLKNNELKLAGKKIASEYLHGDAPDIKEYENSIASYKGKERSLIIAGISEVLGANINLPKDESFEEILTRIKEALVLISRDKRKGAYVIDQITGFFRQYLQNREQIREQLKKQYEPQLKAKQKELAKQFGQEIKLSPEQDPEFNTLLQRNFKRMDDQYREALIEVKEELTALTRDT